ncbi:hypothetical protein [Pseudomonas sp. RA_15y_Pfl2_54]|uniref:hypothetical protein n=1 Tax=Pseudomonas sp. RA_15y_Pfl2_54 TaxID=3088704 RepID=UPI0030DD1934
MHAQKPSGSGIEASTNIFTACDEVSFVAARIAGYSVRMHEGMSAKTANESVQPSKHAASYLLERLNAPSGQYPQPRAPFSLEQA